MEKNKFWGGAVIGVAVFVMFLAMWDPRISVGVAVVALLGVGIWNLVQKTEGKPGSATSFGVAQQEQKKEHLQKILELLESKSFGTAQDGNARISNDEVQKLLGVSDKTVQRYFNELQAEGKIKQVGETGKSVYYTK